MISKAKIKLIRSLELKKNRKALGLFVAEGPKVVGDLLDANTPSVIIAATSQWLQQNAGCLDSLLHVNGGMSAVASGTSAVAPEVIELTDEELRHLSFLQHPQQVLAVFRIPTDNSSAQSISTVPPLGGVQVGLCLDSVQDPGNLGTIIRIADWFGIENIYCSPDTADVWNPKVIQATMGSIARVHLTYCDLNALLDSLPADFPVYGTLLDGDDINAAHLENRGLIIMGNEGNGISKEIARRVSHRLLIPNYPAGRKTADSLNVAIATAITCFAIRKA